MIVGTVSMGSLSLASASDCGCQPKKPNPIYRSLDAVAGGIEKLFGLDKCNKCCDETACDEAVSWGDSFDGSHGEAGMWPQGEVPLNLTPSHGHSHHGHSHSGHGHRAIPMPPPEMMPHSVPDNAPLPPTVIHDHSPRHSGSSVEVSPLGKSQWGSTRMSQPRLVPTPQRDQSQAQALGNSAPLSDPPSSQSLQSEPRIPAPVPGSNTNSEEGSLFDSLSNPFSDDEVHVRRYQPVRPSSYQASVGSSKSDGPSQTSSSRRSVSKSYRESSRRTSSSR